MNVKIENDIQFVEGKTNDLAQAEASTRNYLLFIIKSSAAVVGLILFGLSATPVIKFVHSGLQDHLSALVERSSVISTPGTRPILLQSLVLPLAHFFLDPKNVELKRQYKSSGDVYEKGLLDMQYCNIGDHNRVFSRNDAMMTQNDEEVRPLSLTHADFALHHNKNCMTPEEVMDAMKYGTRNWDDPAILNTVEGHRYPERFQSYFVPYKCNVPALSPKRVCDVLNRFSKVVFAGDSLLRHVRQGFFMTLNNDFIHGSMISSSNKANRCQCDGQFSEHLDCRVNDGFFNAMKPSQMGLCPWPSSLTQRRVGDEFTYAGFEWPDLGLDIWNDIDCANNPDFRGLALIIQGGLHFRLSPTKVFDEFINLHLSNPKYLQCKKMNKVVVIWTSMIGQAHILDPVFPIQTREKVIMFNEEMARKLENTDVKILDVFKFTKDAQTSDGLHKLMDVNIFQAYYTIQLIDFLSSGSS